MANVKVCSIPNCGKNVRAKGLCPAHYMRMRDGLDMQSTKAEKGESIKTLLLSLMAETDECVIWPYAKGSGGYAAMKFERSLDSVSRIACHIKNGPPPSPEYQAAHNCGNGHLGCYNWKHLQWKTPLDNTADKYIHGTIVRGSMSKQAKLTESDVLAIRERLSSGEKLKPIAEDYGVLISTISSVRVGGRGWKHVK